MGHHVCWAGNRGWKPGASGVLRREWGDTATKHEEGLLLIHVNAGYGFVLLVLFSIKLTLSKA